MTATQAPTPGPLTDGMDAYTTPEAIEAVTSRLAPTAPVEASGSEPEWKKRLSEVHAGGQVGDVYAAFPSPKSTFQGDIGHALAALRPQPSGETQEAEARNLELSMLAYGWMEAHDLLASGKPYLFPSPADVPESIARAIAAEARADRLAKALVMLGGEKPEQKRSYPNSYRGGFDAATDLAASIARAALQQETQP